MILSPHHTTENLMSIDRGIWIQSKPRTGVTLSQLNKLPVRDCWIYMDTLCVPKGNSIRDITLVSAHRTPSCTHRRRFKDWDFATFCRFLLCVCTVFFSLIQFRKFLKKWWVKVFLLTNFWKGFRGVLSRVFLERDDPQAEGAVLSLEIRCSAFVKSPRAWFYQWVWIHDVWSLSV